MRSPQIGDSVRHYEGDKIVFEGYIAGIVGFVAQIVGGPPGMPTPWITSHNDGRVSTEEGGDIVSLLELVRGLNGWRWAPYDGRPEVGDVLRHDGRVEEEYLVTGMNGRHPLLCEIRLGTVDERPLQMDGSVLAKAVAGIDGWSWEPARWSK